MADDGCPRRWKGRWSFNLDYIMARSKGNKLRLVKGILHLVFSIVYAVGDFGVVAAFGRVMETPICLISTHKQWDFFRQNHR